MTGIDPRRPAGPAILAVIVGLGVTGCSTKHPSPITEASGRVVQPLADLPYWRVEGRLGVKSSQGGINANLFWEHDGHQDRVRISGPFSQGAVSIILQPDLILINEGNGRVETARDPEEALKNRLGFDVPVMSLRYWMLGIPAPDRAEPATRTGAPGDAGFTQRGWSLKYENFTRLEGQEVPQKISLQGQDARLKLVIDNWAGNKTQ